ncbi:hypothetical protein POM88_048462 [Heracleum sosnowskyi]|uniref:Uncharacterized protein n=1 Tax=Heracleum sosnowskyi TaxID=360622 RepID=A0AAD8GV95_9APIA|nr:hypothetical protein POM88_048462 [Heracleum sosnowskyi]
MANWTLSDVYSKMNSVASSGINFVSSIAGEATMSEAQPPPYKTTLRNSNGNRKRSPPTNVGQSGVDAQAKRSSTGSHSYIPSHDQIMENVQPAWGNFSSSAAKFIKNSFNK